MGQGKGKGGTEIMNETESDTKLYDQEKDVVEERSWYSTGYASVRREDVSAVVWERFTYRRFVGPWERRDV
jgi:hypothetical protein